MGEAITRKAAARRELVIEFRANKKKWHRLAKMLRQYRKLFDKDGDWMWLVTQYVVNQGGEPRSLRLISFRGNVARLSGYFYYGGCIIHVWYFLSPSRSTYELLLKLCLENI